MRKLCLIMTSSLVTIAAVLAACNDTKTSETPKEVTQAQLVKRGDYLVSAIGCDDCHSPKRMGARGPEVIPELRLSGYPSDRPVDKVNTTALQNGWISMSPDLTAAAGPWGVSFAANITSDGTGVGNWKDENFINAMRHGKIKGLANARQMLPPMPWFNFSKLTDEDLRSILAYLKTTNPVRNIPPEPLPPTTL